MTALQTPPNDALAEEWGRFAVSIPGWRNPLRLPARCVVDDEWGPLPDPDHWAWEGWLLRLLSFAGISMHLDSEDCVRVEWWSPYDLEGDPHVFEAPTIGRVCIMVAAHNGKWPGGDR